MCSMPPQEAHTIIVLRRGDRRWTVLVVQKYNFLRWRTSSAVVAAPLPLLLPPCSPTLFMDTKQSASASSPSVPCCARYWYASWAERGVIMAEAVMNEFRIFEFQYDVIVAANARRRKAPTTKMGACFWWRCSRLLALIYISPEEY